MGVVIAVALAAVLGMGAREAVAKVDKCKRRCAVVFTRGGSNCQHKVKNAIRKRQKACKTDFSTTGFASVGKCRTAARTFGVSLIKNVCNGTSKQACLACCASGGTPDVCGPRSPSGAFLDGAGPLL
ncbi:MAG TPA: hypothetical protein VFD84_05935 [Candidatus Binatia bacterium]|nr:hypothetical protein [Candidatus Binatia bacterium]